MRPLVGVWVLLVEGVNVLFFYQGQWPWEAAVALSVVCLVVVLRSGLLRATNLRWALTGAILFAGIVVPWLSGTYAGRLPWFLGSLALEFFLGAWVWWAFRGRIVRPDGSVAIIGRAKGLLAPRVQIAGDDRFLHLHVLGPTGSGKTEGVLWPLIHQDLQRGAGVFVLDPKGDLAKRTAEAAKVLGRKVVSIGPDEPLTLNPLAGDPEMAAQSLVEAMDRIFPVEDIFFRTLGRTLLRQSILVLKGIAGKEPHLKDLSDFLADEDTRREALVRTRAEEAKGYFRREYGQWTAKAQREYTLGLRNALMALSDQKDVRRILSGDEEMDFDEMLRDGTVLTVSLPAGSLGAAGKILGAYLLARLQSAVLLRTDGPPAFLYIDEFQQFAAPSFTEFLELARQYRVGAILAHQNLAQLPSQLRSSVLANARNRVLLGGLSGEDLKEMEDSLGKKVGVRVTEGASGEVRSRTLIEEPRYAPDFVRRLPRGRAIAQLAQRGQILEPRLVVLPTPDGP